VCSRASAHLQRERVSDRGEYSVLEAGVARDLLVKGELILLK
jgi:hypothetical protein